MSGIGHIGELQAIAYFQKKLKIPVYLPLKDKGIDFIAAGDDKYFKFK